MPSCKLNLCATLISTSLVFTLLLPCARTNALAVGNGLARTPPMGWNSWNKFACNVSEQLIKESADGRGASGMKKAGYQYVYIDDCWEVSRDWACNSGPDPARC